LDEEFHCHRQEGGPAITQVLFSSAFGTVHIKAVLIEKLKTLEYMAD
jgi:hypothetical protein